MEVDENTYKEVLSNALKDVLQELLIRDGDDQYLVYIHDIQYRNNQVIIDWTTPHDDVDKDKLFLLVQNAVKAQIGDIKLSFFDRLLNFFKLSR